MITSTEVNKVLPALKAVKSKLQAVAKKANNPFFKSKYADLNTYLEEVEPLLEEAGLVLMQPVVSIVTNNMVVSRIYHVETGQYVESSMRLVGETDMQKAGSAVTYARRYTLGALLSMKAEDDDGNHAVGKTDKPKTATTTTSSGGSSVSTSAPAITNAPITTAARPSFRKPSKPAAAPVQETESSGDDL